MKRVVKLTEQDLYRIVKRVIKEQEAPAAKAAPAAPAAKPTGYVDPKTALELVKNTADLEKIIINLKGSPVLIKYKSDASSDQRKLYDVYSICVSKDGIPAAYASGTLSVDYTQKTGGNVNQSFTSNNIQSCPTENISADQNAKKYWSLSNSYVGNAKPENVIALIKQWNQKYNKVNFTGLKNLLQNADQYGKGVINGLSS